ncbi:MAG: DUF1501 domain-containing protein [Planctomycetaceae bacterium]|nr:DUF1501 domain-containing protein [Planctomycetaceae bacterium]
MTNYWHELVSTTRRGFSRRSLLQSLPAAAFATSLPQLMGAESENLRKRHKAVIMLWMSGGPSQLETLDPKPGHENGGDTKAIQTSVPGIEIAEFWPETAKVMDHFAVIRSLTNKEGNHQRATYQLHTGYIPTGSVKHPSLGSNVARQIAQEDLKIPSVVSVGRAAGVTAGFLGVQYEPFVINNPATPPENTRPLVTEQRYGRRLDLLEQLEREFASRGAEQSVTDHSAIYRKSSDMILSPDLKAFDISQEPSELRAQYGDTQFGRGCLLARRLIEHGVTYVEVQSNGWDTHFDNFDRIGELAGQVDPAMATLIRDLDDRGLLEDTLVVWMGEFGRTPRINGRGGRDHFPRAFNGMLAGCGVHGGQVIGATSPDGNLVQDRPVSVPDLFHTICHAVGVNPLSETMSPLGRPMKVVEGGEIVKEVFSGKA